MKLYHFDLTKSKFRDGNAIRYGWDPVQKTSLCACKENFTVAHALHCPKEWCTIMRQNKLCDYLVNWYLSWCRDRTSTTTTIRSQGPPGLLESRFNKVDFDVKTFNSMTKKVALKDVVKPTSTMSLFKKTNMNKEKLSGWENNILSACLRMHLWSWSISYKSVETIEIQALCAREHIYADIISYLRSKISFALLGSSILCIRNCWCFDGSCGWRSKGVFLTRILSSLVVCFLLLSVFCFTFSDGECVYYRLIERFKQYGMVYADVALTGPRTSQYSPSVGKGHFYFNFLLVCIHVWEA